MLSFCDSNPGRDVFVTGIGLVTPLALSAGETWNRLIKGDRAGRSLSANDIDHFEQLCEIPGLPVTGAPVNQCEVARLLALILKSSSIPVGVQAAWHSEPLVAMTLVALHEAMTQSGLQQLPADPQRTAVVFGSSKGGLRTAERLTQRLRSQIIPSPYIEQHPSLATPGLPDLSGHVPDFGPLWMHAFQPDSATRAIAAITGAQAGITCPVAACATGLIAVLQGAVMVHSGLCDVCIVGSADSGLRASVMSSFHRLRVASRSCDAASACRPFDESRDGFLIGEGAGVMILESRAHASARGAAGLAKVISGGWLSDPTGMTQIDTSGVVVAELLRRTGASGISPPDVISLHGTGTESNDLAESRGICEVFGDSTPLCFGIKGAIGHLLGAAGSVETATAILALSQKSVPGTTNLQAQDSQCRIRLHSQSQQRPELRRAAKLSLGFGGHVAFGLFEAADA